MSKTVLVVTKTDDNAGVQLVQEALAQRGAKTFRLDTDLFPTEVKLALRQPRGRSTLRQNGAQVVLGDLDAVWYRRSHIGAKLPADMDRQERNAALTETNATLFGMLEMLDVPFIDRVQTVRAANHKARQLEIAAAVGLDVPDTLSTNDPEAVRAFWDVCHGRMIGKMLSSFAIYDAAGREQVMFTSVMKAEDLEHLDQLALCPMTFQEHLEKKIELRVTVIGEKLYACAVDSQAFLNVSVRKIDGRAIRLAKNADIPAANCASDRCVYSARTTSVVRRNAGHGCPKPARSMSSM